MERPVVRFTRGQRPSRSLPTDEVVIPKYPPEPGQPSRLSWWMVLAPIGGVLVMGVAMGLVYHNYIYPVIIASASMVYPVVMVLRQRDQDRRYRDEKERIQKAYERRMGEVEDELNRLRQRQSECLTSTYPTVEEILEWARQVSTRLWERRPDEPDFLEIRLGLGSVPASYRVKVPQVDFPELAPPLMLQAAETAETFRYVPDMPITVHLQDQGSLAVTGPRPWREGMARTILSQIAGLHSPDEVDLYAVYPADKAEDWAWLKWLPHARALRGGGRHHLAYDPVSVRQVLSGVMDELETRQVRKMRGGTSPSERVPSLVLFLADYDMVRGEAVVARLLDQGREVNASVVLLAPRPLDLPERCATRLDLTNEERASIQRHEEPQPQEFRPEMTAVKVAEAIARRLAPLSLADSQTLADLPDEVRLLDMLGIGDPALVDLESRWLEAAGRPPSLTATVGVRQGQRPLHIDLKQSGAGPHGLIAGTTGSGKSELLLTLITGLAVNHHPHQVNFVLVDYKGGTAMSMLADLPHTVGFVTDLDGKQTRRALVALRSEMARREEVLTRYQVLDIDKYHQLGNVEPFPYLFIVIDEFAELKERFKNDLADVLREFVSVAQKGRALGVHLVLAMQKPEGVVNDSIRANMKYRICLRVERAEDSRNVIGRTEAYLLPAQPPGRAYFQVGNNEQFDLFQVARVAAFHHPAAEPAAPRPTAVIQEVGPDGRRVPLLEIGPRRPAEAAPPAEARTEAQVLVEMARQTAERMGIQRLPSPWPAPLPTVLPLGDLMARSGLAGWDGTGWPPRSGAGEAMKPVPVGLLDQPIRQRQVPWMIRPTEEGNLVAVGAPGSGRTTFLLTLVTSLALAHPPDRLHVHLVDFAGHQLGAALAGFPHIAGAYTASEIDRLRRLLLALEAELEVRKETFSRARVVNLAGYCSAMPDKPLPAVLTVINGFSSFVDVFRDELQGWVRLLREGSAYGLLFALSTDRQPPSQVADLLSVRLALKLTDPTWYPIILGARPDLTTFDPVPGRGFIGSKPPEEVQIALPAAGPPEAQITALKTLGEQMDHAWRGPRPRPIRVLAERVSLGEVLPPGALEHWPVLQDPVTWIGLDDQRLEPAVFDLTRIGPLFLVSGPPECGKTTALATMGVGLAATHRPDSLHIALIALNRSERYPLEVVADLPHSLGMAGRERAIEYLLTTLENHILSGSTAPGGEAAPITHTVLLIDDYHLLANRVPGQLLARLESLARAGLEGGLTIVVSTAATALTGAGDGLLRQLKAGRNGLWLRATEASESQLLGVVIPPAIRKKNLPPGRGFLYGPGGQVIVQIASPEVPADGEPSLPHTLAGWVEAIRKRAA